MVFCPFTYHYNLVIQGREENCLRTEPQSCRFQGFLDKFFLEATFCVHFPLREHSLGLVGEGLTFCAAKQMWR